MKLEVVVTKMSRRGRGKVKVRRGGFGIVVKSHLEREKNRKKRIFAFGRHAFQCFLSETLMAILLIILVAHCKKRLCWRESDLDSQFIAKMLNTWYSVVAWLSRQTVRNTLP
jgi:hypothetical protein